MRKLLSVLVRCRTLSTVRVHLPSSRFVRPFSSTADKTLERLKNFLQEEKEAVRKLNTELAIPYTDIDLLAHDLKSKSQHRTSSSALLQASYNGQLHRPAIPIKYIMANPSAVQENLKNRKLQSGMIDIRNDIIRPYERIHRIKHELDRYSKKKEKLTKSMQGFWMKHSEDEKVPIPAEIEKHRQDAIRLSCIISLLSWILDQVEKVFYEKALLLPNATKPSVPVGDESVAEVLKTVGELPKLSHGVVEHLEVGEITSTIRQNNMTNFCGQRTYYLFKEAAELEHALVQYTIDRLRSKGFLLISCPNILHASAFEGCGVASTKLSDMLYHIDHRQEDDFYIAGTSEVGIAAFLANHSISPKHLPLRLCSVSTCNRKETDNRLDARGLYRVHHFTKVEMFGVTANESGKESEELFHEFLEIQEELFGDLGLHFRVMNMPTGELGLPAYQKVDMEAWMSGRNSFGEISSTSNCTDFQSRRLHILYKNGSEYKFAHTLNGTACAIPRVVIALLENNQTKEKVVELPQVLEQYLIRTRIDRSSKMFMEYIGPNQSKNKRKTPKE